MNISLGVCLAIHVAAMFQWEPAYTVPGFKSFIQLPSGDLLSANTTPPSASGRTIHCFRSRDLGRTWEFLSEIINDSRSTIDLGDGTFLRRRNGEVLFVYRHNMTSYSNQALPLEDNTYAIEVAVSRDDGVTWQPHSVVKSYKGTQMGLWSPALFERSDGVLQCYHDDEHLPEQQGLARHQWAVMWTWNPNTQQWVDQVVVSRAHDPKHLSRDGMCSVVELPSGRILCALESVQTNPPHRGCLRIVSSDDGGKTWSWQKTERPIMYAPENPLFNALSPWMIQLSNGMLMAVFLSDEDRQEPGVCAINRSDLDVRYLISRDDGITWEKPREILVPAAYEGKAMWRYTINEPGKGWEMQGFDDSKWEQGPAGFGMFGTPPQPVGTQWSSGDIWLRRIFRIEGEPPSYPHFRIWHNEDAEVYINGVAAAKLSNYNDGYKDFLLTPEAQAALKKGDNLLAAHCRQTVGGQFIDIGLYDFQHIIDNGHNLWWPGLCEIKGEEGCITVLANYPLHSTWEIKARQGIMVQSKE